LLFATTCMQPWRFAVKHALEFIMILLAVATVSAVLYAAVMPDPSDTKKEEARSAKGASADAEREDRERSR